MVTLRQGILKCVVHITDMDKLQICNALLFLYMYVKWYPQVSKHHTLIVST